MREPYTAEWSQGGLLPDAPYLGLWEPGEDARRPANALPGKIKALRLASAGARILWARDSAKIDRCEEKSYAGKKSSEGVRLEQALGHC